MEENTSNCPLSAWMDRENACRTRQGSDGNTWIKVYFGSGAHFRNWHAQYVEIYGEENIEVEPVDMKGRACFGEGDHTAYRIWARQLSS